MATDEATRLHLYEQARASWGAEAADTLMRSLPWDTEQLATKSDLAVLEHKLDLLKAELLGAIDRSAAGQTRYYVGTTITLVLAMVGIVVGLS